MILGATNVTAATNSPIHQRETSAVTTPAPTAAATVMPREGASAVNDIGVR